MRDFGDWVQELWIIKLFGFSPKRHYKALHGDVMPELWGKALYWRFSIFDLFMAEHRSQRMNGDNSWAQRTITAQWSNLLLFVFLTAFSLTSGTSIITVQFTLFMCIFKNKIFLHKSENLCKTIFSNKPVSLFLLEIQPSHAFLNDTSTRFKLMVVW